MSAVIVVSHVCVNDELIYA